MRLTPSEIEALPRELPSPLLDTKWVTLRDWKSEWVPKIFNELDRASKAPGWNPKVVHLEDSLFFIDVCAEASLHPPLSSVSGTKGGIIYRDISLNVPSAIKVVEWIDHPILKVLPSNTPRAVKSVYKKEVRMKYARMEDCMPFLGDMRLAEEAWKDYLEKLQ